QKSTGGTPGEVVGVSGSGIEVAAGSGMLLLAEVQLEGKKKMSAADFIKGHRLEPGTVFEDDRELCS
ncbi:MAG: methionyl-tRNA formyltransferase, partial [Deltaproteobacteria bacterium]|nr:methionyl-tRNA formyltransferase [Deltaproteobacteria bacterium]